MPQPRPAFPIPKFPPPELNNWMFPSPELNKLIRQAARFAAEPDWLPPVSPIPILLPPIPAKPVIVVTQPRLLPPVLAKPMLALAWAKLPGCCRSRLPKLIL